MVAGDIFSSVGDSPTRAPHCRQCWYIALPLESSSQPEPLLDRLNHTDTGFRLVISTNTPTAAKLVSGLPHGQFTHVYLPLDYSFAVKRFLSRICPNCVLILETEIWPNLILQAARKNITTAIVNGRLSSKTPAGEENAEK